MSNAIDILSLGAGVQSSTMALMAEMGLILPKPVCGIFSDVEESEPKSVYDWLTWLESQLSYPIYRVSKGSLYNDLLQSAADKKTRVPSPPLFTETGILMRQCTQDYKLAPIKKKIREICGKQEAVVWIGISQDEVYRMKPSTNKRITHRWPLIELGMSRYDCLRWMEKNGYPKPPRSSCVFCPYHSDAEWRRLKTEEPAEFARAVKIDEAIRSGIRNTTQNLFLHKTKKPLSEVDFSTDEERGQTNMFNNECEGMCGV